MDKIIGAQYYTIRDYTKTIEDFDASCKKISDMGYKAVQISGQPLDASEMRKVLDKYGLKVYLTHKSCKDFFEDIDGVIEYNKALGCDLCGMGSMSKEYIESNESLTDFITKINKACERLKAEGMYFGYHNHSFEFFKFDGKEIFDRLIEETDPEIFNFIVDTYWLQHGGKNPPDVIRKLGKRAMAIHFKDYGIFYNDEGKLKPAICEVGRGNLDWDAIFAACEDAGSRFAVVEQDNNHFEGDPFKSLKMSYDFLSSKGFC